MTAGGISDPGLGAALGPWLWTGALLVLAVAVVIGAVEGMSGRAPRASMRLSALGTLLIAAFGTLCLSGPGEVTASLGTALGFATIDVRYDALSGVFVLILGIVGLAASVAAIDGLSHEPSSALTGMAYPVFILSMVLVFGSASGFAFLLAWELMALSSAVLVIGARPSVEHLRSGYLYIAFTHLATAALVIAFAILWTQGAGDPRFSSWAAAAAALPPGARDLVFGLLVVGFGTKAGAMPFHVWLPRAHPVAPSHVSALMSGVMIKTGIYGLIRLGLEVMGPGPDWWGVLLIVIGSASAVMGILYALMEHDLKRLLAFSSIENIGIILLGLGAAVVLRAHGLASLAAVGLVAALFHSVNHALFKGLLFLGAGAVQHASGDRNLNRLGGLIRVMPRAALLFGVGAAAISGLPPLNGFASEWLTFESLIGLGGSTSIPPLVRSIGLLAVGALALTAALSLAAFVKATGMTFLALPRSARVAATAHDAARGELAGMGLLAVLCVGMGLAAGAASGGLTTLAGSLLGGVTEPPTAVTIGAATRPAGSVAPLLLAVALLGVAGAAGLASAAGGRRGIVRRVATWTCGILPDAVMEYTATSYAKPIRLFFRRVLLPERTLVTEYHPGSPVPHSMRYQGTVTHVFESHLFRPLHRVAIRGAQLVRRLQGGSLQLYLAYALGALVLLLVVAR